MLRGRILNWTQNFLSLSFIPLSCQHIESVETAKTDSRQSKDIFLNNFFKKLNKDVIGFAYDSTQLLNSTRLIRRRTTEKKTHIFLFYVRLQSHNLSMIRDLVSQLDATVVEIFQPILHPPSSILQLMCLWIWLWARSHKRIDE